MLPRLPIRCLPLLVLLIVGACQQAPQPVSRSDLLMGTVVDIVAVAPPEVAEPAIREAFAEIRRVEELMSPHLEQSEIARLAASSGSLTVSAETAAVLRLGLEVARASGGAFDLTLGRLKQLWGVETATPQVPTPDQIADALRGTGPQALRLEGREVRKADPTLQVDLGGIAKGYAIDRAIGVLRRAGIRHASVNAGGDLRLLGNRGERRWRIGIQHPRRPGELLATLELADVAVVTSGDYQRYFERDGVRYHHLFDPQTGRPARVCQSVTVIADSALLADALATAAFVLGPEAGLELLRDYAVEGLIVAADGRVTATAALADQVPRP